MLHCFGFHFHPNTIEGWSHISHYVGAYVWTPPMPHPTFPLLAVQIHKWKVGDQSYMEASRSQLWNGHKSGMLRTLSQFGKGMHQSSYKCSKAVMLCMVGTLRWVLLWEKEWINMQWTFTATHMHAFQYTFIASKETCLFLGCTFKRDMTNLKPT